MKYFSIFTLEDGIEPVYINRAFSREKSNLRKQCYILYQMNNQYLYISCCLFITNFSSITLQILHYEYCGKYN